MAVHAKGRNVKKGPSRAGAQRFKPNKSRKGRTHAGNPVRRHGRK